MGKKKKRLRKTTVHGSIEGVREMAFIEFLCEIYVPPENNIAFKPNYTSGGTPDKIIGDAIRACHCHDKAFCWLDEDFEPNESPLSKEMRIALAECWNLKGQAIDGLLLCPLGELQQKFNSNYRKPILIVSQPVCSESVILAALGYSLLYKKYDPQKRKSQIDGLKNKLDQLMKGELTAQQQIEYYRQHLNKAKLEEKKKDVPELALLVSMITN